MSYLLHIRKPIQRHEHRGSQECNLTTELRAFQSFTKLKIQIKQAAVAGYFYNELNHISCDISSYWPEKLHDGNGLMWRLYGPFKCVYHVYEKSPFEIPTYVIFMTLWVDLEHCVHECYMLIFMVLFDGRTSQCVLSFINLFLLSINMQM